eukprot:scaffold131714_cov63-Phaeocystis_antarctica.AAC.1
MAPPHVPLWRARSRQSLSSKHTRGHTPPCAGPSQRHDARSIQQVSDHEGMAQFVTAFMRSSLNESAVDYTFLAAQGVATSHVLTKLITPARLLADHMPGVRSIDYVNVD